MRKKRGYVYTQSIYILGSCMYAKIFKSGNSQAVRLPKEFRFEVDEVEIFKRGDEVVLRPKSIGRLDLAEILADMPDDFLSDGRNDLPPQKRESF